MSSRTDEVDIDEPELDDAASGGAAETTDNELDADELDDDAEATKQAPPVRFTAPTPRWLTWVMIVSIVLAVAAPVGTAWVYFTQFRPDHAVSANLKGEVIAAASEGAIAVLSYSPDTFDADAVTAKSHLTGEFLAYYGPFAEKVLAPAAKDGGATSSASVQRSAIIDITPESATVLLFVNQSQSSKDRPQPGLSSNVVRVELIKVDGAWLIQQFGPV